MSVSLPQTSPEHGSLLSKLFAAVRPEFRSDLLRPDPDDPVLGRGSCCVDPCARLAWAGGLCAAHYNQWRREGKPDVARFARTAAPVVERANSGRVDAFDLSGLPPQAKLEVAYTLQRRSDERGAGIYRTAVGHVVELIRSSGTSSLLEHPLERWLEASRRAGIKGTSRTEALLRYAYRCLEDLDTGGDVEIEYAKDSWEASRLGIFVRRAPRRLPFAPIAQPWLKAAVKRWARFRLSTGKAFGTVHVDVKALIWFARFLDAKHPGAEDESAISRETLEGYLAWLASSHLVTHTKGTYLASLRGFLDSCRRHGWLERLPAGAMLYHDDFPGRGEDLPRFISEFVMSQLESEANLARLPDTTTRHLAIVLMETGLRAGDACCLPYSCIVADSSGWPCLHFHNSKVATDQLIPLSAKAAVAVRAQQEEVARRFPNGSPWLFPAVRSNPDGAKPYPYGTLLPRLARWQSDIGLKDESGRPVHVSPHQFRHTVGTRLINAGVPQHVVQKLLGHASPQMTARYARIHDSTVRQEFDRYHQSRVNILGEVLGYDPDAPTANAEWVKHNLARVQASLPNGYCGRPPQQDCPHPNACLTCPDFQTTVVFLPVHRQQAENNRVLVATAEANGNSRLLANHRKVQESLDRIIPALEAVESGEERGDAG
ncbi:MAG: tyrosine-type recombinase/integrase [Actinomycetota bacterium]